MTIGLMLTFFDFRNDVRALIKSLCTSHEVIVFIRREHIAKIEPFLIPGMSYRIIDEQIPNLRNHIFVRLFHLMKRLPESRHNYYLMESFKANGVEDLKLRKRANRILQIQQYLPHWISYDFYLNKLQYSGKTDLRGIDKMVVFTEIYDDFLLARLLNEKIETQLYVYSWDHACKHVRFSKRANYLVWHEGIQLDLHTLQHIPLQNIHVLGATQLGYIVQYKATPKPEKTQNKYFVFGSGIGISSLIHDEIDVIVQLAACIQSTHPEYKLIVRPYPQLRDWSPYDRLLTLANVELDDNYRQNDLSVTDDAILSKFRTIEHATAFFHLGTTLGLEACFTKCPSFIIDFDSKANKSNSIYNFTHQYQNEKYLMPKHSLNTIRSIKHLKEILSELPDTKYLIANERIANEFFPLSFDQLAAVLGSTDEKQLYNSKPTLTRNSTTNS